MGQLVPGGRLDISALGDEVNEAARIQAAGPDETLVSFARPVRLLTAGGTQPRPVSMRR
jgi:class 3 adenylate cyclase